MNLIVNLGFQENIYGKNIYMEIGIYPYFHFMDIGKLLSSINDILVFISPNKLSKS